jgi:transposase
MTRLRGRCLRGKRLVAKVPHGHWKMTTFVAGLRQGGMTAPFVVDAPMNGEIFLTYLEQCLVPTLSPGEIVSMDNLPAHKVAGVREMIEATGAMLWMLPAYSPDLNPIERSKHISEKQASVQSPLYGTALEQSSKASPRKSAKTTSRT